MSQRSWIEGTLENERRRCARAESERDRYREALERCPICGHEWSRHDPEDGQCDAHSDEEGVFGVCRCGRDIVFQQERNAILSTKALAPEEEGEDG